MQQGIPVWAMHLLRVLYTTIKKFDHINYSNRLENLILRYEEPSSMVRWDSPLFTVAWNDEKIPEDAIWRAITQGDVKPANAGTRAVRTDMDTNTKYILTLKL